MKNRKKAIGARTVLFPLMLGMLGGVSASAAPETSWDVSLGSLAEAYSDYFMVGNIIEPGQVADKDTTEMFAYCYNAVTAENSMKPVSLTNAKGSYNFSNADRMVQWAEDNGIAVHGHTLVWHSQSARWLTMDNGGNVLTRAEAKANMEEYINEVAGHYAGKVISWDVVNEAITTSVSSIPLNWKSVLRKEGQDGSTWYQAYENGADKDKGESGADYIYDAFVFARLADPGAILYYNDYNETSLGKREAIAMMVEELNEQWKEDSRNTEPDRLLVEGIGMQSHFFTEDLNVSDVDKTITRFKHTGAEISVSELDIPQGRYNTYTQRKEAPTQEEEQFQAELYRQLFEVYKKHADSIARVTIWGKADSQSWRREGYPVLFNRDLTAKETYRAIMEASLTPPEAVETTVTAVITTAAATEETESEVSDEPDISDENTADETVSESDSATSISIFAIIAIIAAVVLVAAGIIVFAVLKGKKK